MIIFFGVKIMANMCNNWVEISGDEKQVKQFIELVGKEFDFNKVIPTETDTRGEANEKWGCSSIAFDLEFDDLGNGYANWYFWTKWNPPRKIYQALREKFSDVFISWRYEEPGMGLYGYLQNDEDV